MPNFPTQSRRVYSISMKASWLARRDWWSFFATPISGTRERRVRGLRNRQSSFAQPKVGVEPGPLLLRAGAAVAAAVVAPAALALVPLTVPAAEEDAQCQRLLAESSKK